MSDYEDSSSNTINNIHNEILNEYNDDQNNSVNKINSQIKNNYISRNGSKLNLSGINLSSEEGLMLINNISQKYPNIKKIKLNNCNLSSLPSELFNLKELTALDIRNNKFNDFEKLIKDLSKLNNLIELEIDLEDQNEVLFTLTNIPRLNKLNGKITKNSFTIVDIDIKDIEDISLQNYLDEYNEIVNRLNKKDETYANKFQKKIYEEGEKIKNSLNKNIPNYIYANNILKSQLELEKNLAEKFLENLDEENSVIANFLFKIIFKTGDRLVNLINLLYPKIEEKTENLRNELEEAWKAAGEISDYETKYKNIKNTKIILESNIELLQKKINKLEKENKIITQKLNKKTKDIIKKNENINNRNIIYNKNTSDKNNYQNNIYNKSTNYQDNNKEFKHLKTNPNNSYNQNQSYLKSAMNNNNYNNNLLNDLSNTNNNTQNNINDNQFINNNINYFLNPNRKPLSIKVAKDLINELYNSKANYDKICIENKLPNVTLEQYMYIFLNNKYGLKNLVIDWASALINAIKLYSNEDCEINLFGKILRNEQEEDSRLILNKLKDNISELLEYYYRSKYPLKSQKEIKKIMDQKKNGVLLEEEWKGIINYLYNNEDSQIIENKIMEFIQDQNNKLFFILENGEDVNNDRFITYQNQNNQNNTERFNNLTKKLNNNLTDIFLTDKKKVTRDDITNINKLKFEVNIPYKDFIQIVCENQIQNREKYLKNFVNLFKRFDKDGDGVLNEEQFIDMIKAIPYCQNNIEEYVDKFLRLIDPFNHKKFTFNNCVFLFSMEKIDENNMTQSFFSQGLSTIESPNIGLNIQDETSLLDRICIGS